MWPTEPIRVSHAFVRADIPSVLSSSRNFCRAPFTSWYAATPRSTSPAAPTSQRPAGHSKTPAVVRSGLDDGPPAGGEAAGRLVGTRPGPAEGGPGPDRQVPWAGPS